MSVEVRSGLTVRAAEATDTDAIVRMALRFVERSSYRDQLPSIEAFLAARRPVAAHRTSCSWWCGEDRHGRLVGMLGMAMLRRRSVARRSPPRSPGG